MKRITAWTADTALFLMALPLIVIFTISLGLLAALGDLGQRVEKWGKS